MLDPKKKKAIIIGSILFFVVLPIVATVVWFVAQRIAPDPNSGTRIAIANFDENVQNISDTRRKGILGAVWKIVKYNNPELADATAIKDAIIRTNSATQDEVTTGVQYSGDFIVDIESLKQSYGVRYAYSTDEYDTFDAGVPSLAYCLEKTNLKYGPFDCKDPLKGQVSVGDSFLDNLPYTGSLYTVSDGFRDADNKRLIVVKLLLNSKNVSTDIVERRKTQAREWITAQAGSVDAYSVKFVDLFGNDVTEPPKPQEL